MKKTLLLACAFALAAMSSFSYAEIYDPPDKSYVSSIDIECKAAPALPADQVDNRATVKTAALELGARTCHGTVAATDSDVPHVFGTGADWQGTIRHATANPEIADA